MQYVTRVVDPKEAETAVLRIWRDNRSAHGTLDATYRWYYLDNPEAVGCCLLLEQAADHGSAEPVGSTGVGARCLSIDGQTVRAGLMGDFFVDRSHRSLFPAMQLQRAALTAAQTRFSVLYGFPNDKAINVFRRLGFVELGRTTRYVKVLNFAPYVQRRLATAPRLASLLARAAVALARLPRPLARLRAFGHRASWGEPPPEQLAQLNERVTLGAKVRGQRDQRFLRWRFIDKPDSKARIFAVHAKRSGQLAGYAVVEREADVAHIRDVLAPDATQLRIVLSALELEMARERCSALSCSLLPTPAVARVFEALGFVRRTPERVVVASGQGPSTGWLLTEADEDQ